ECSRRFRLLFYRSNTAPTSLCFCVGRDELSSRHHDAETALPPQVRPGVAEGALPYRRRWRRLPRPARFELVPNAGGTPQRRWHSVSGPIVRRTPFRLADLENGS